jgi:hypothetical protein
MSFIQVKLHNNFAFSVIRLGELVCNVAMAQIMPGRY